MHAAVVCRSLLHIVGNVHGTIGMHCYLCVNACMQYMQNLDACGPYGCVANQTAKRCTKPDGNDVLQGLEEVISLAVKIATHNRFASIL